jgi:hypothetical protein
MNDGKLELLLEQVRRGDTPDKLFMETVLSEAIKMRGRIRQLEANPMIRLGLFIKHNTTIATILIMVIIIVIIYAISSISDLFGINLFEFLIP